MSPARKLTKAQDILIKIRTLSQSIRGHQKALTESWPPLWHYTYQWVTATIADGDARNITEALNRLGKGIQRTFSSCHNWYTMGQYMAKNKIPHTNVNREAIRLTCVYSNVMTDWERSQCNALIRSNDTHGPRKIRKILQKSKKYRTKAAANKARKLRRDGDLNLTRVKMEAMAFGTIASAHFKRAVKVLVVDEDDYELMETKAEFKG